MMNVKRVYLDNCCFNRPFDDQGSIRIRLEAEAKLYIQKKVMSKDLEIIWSYILEYENNANPFEERRSAISEWKKHAVEEILETSDLISKAREIQERRHLKPKDCLHVACAIQGDCDYFLTTDDEIIKKMNGFEEIIVNDPQTFLREVEI